MAELESREPGAYREGITAVLKKISSFNKLGPAVLIDEDLEHADELLGEMGGRLEEPASPTDDDVEAAHDLAAEVNAIFGGRAAPGFPAPGAGAKKKCKKRPRRS